MYFCGGDFIIIIILILDIILFIIGLISLFFTPGHSPNLLSFMGLYCLIDLVHNVYNHFIRSAKNDISDK